MSTVGGFDDDDEDENDADNIVSNPSHVNEESIWSNEQGYLSDNAEHSSESANEDSEGNYISWLLELVIEQGSRHSVLFPS